MALARHYHFKQSMKNPVLLVDHSPTHDLFGDVTPAPGMRTFGDNPVDGVTNLITAGLQLFILIAGILLLIFLLWGAIDWIISGGDKDKINKAQSKITNAILGFLLIFVLLAIFGVITGDILGIVTKTESGQWILQLPTLGGE